MANEEASPMTFERNCVFGVKGVELINPLEDGRWSKFVALHPKATIFHSKEWLAALRKTYGYTPFSVAITSDSGEIAAAIPVCAVESWLTGKRFVSVPFADHCEPLITTSVEMQALIETLKIISRASRYKYFEVRPLSRSFADAERELRLVESSSFSHHTIDLRPTAEELFARFHASCVRRKIRRADRESLKWQSGRSEDMVRHFYRLMVMTRRRHSLFPQPITWFKNLAYEFGERFTIHLASKNKETLAAIITIQHGDKLVYKYGASDESRHALGGMPFLFWKAMQQGKSTGANVFDLGRTDHDGANLSTFKQRLGAEAIPLKYFRIAADVRQKPQFRPRIFMRLFAKLPSPLCCAAGRLLYRHAA